MGIALCVLPGSMAASKRPGKGFIFPSFSVAQQHTGSDPAALRARVCFQPLSLGLRHRVNKESSGMFWQHLYPTHPLRKPFCCKQELSGINYPRGTQAR